MKSLHSVTFVLMWIGSLSSCQRLSGDYHERTGPQNVERHEEELDVKPAAKRRQREHPAKPTETYVDAGLGDPWSTPEACESLLAQGHRHGRTLGTARLATWNVRWFPDGAPGHAVAPSRATDLNWFSCVIAWLDVDAIALQEVKADALSLSKLDGVVDSLNRRTAGKWAYRLDECPSTSGQHVAWLYDGKRVKESFALQYAAVNPHAGACTGHLRPGFGMTFKFEGGLDLHAISVHLKSGVSERDLRLRKQSWAALPGIAASETRRSNDPNLLILGDFNSMGCQKCETAVDSESEIAELDQQLGLGELHLQRMTTDLGCSHYFQRKPAQIDHILVTTDTRALAPSAQVTVEGYCKELHCRHYAGKDPNAYRHLSDHCPLVVELVDRDLD